jgi:predicted small lipoprotein YifL
MLLDARSAVRSLTGMAALMAVMLLVAACGRRGPLEPPPDAAATPRVTRPATPASGRRVAAPPAPAAFGAAATGAQSAADDDASDDDAEAPDQDPAASVAITPTPAAPGSRRRRAYTVPNEPFILDPLL